ncbi:MAG: lysophospholipid acyltransferase family protein [Candidatus Nealsonbacteria bacterium]|nr:lysophospholipid acyltransferase family protein [Candidatus Nealsonbacteria bacterium]
MQRKQIGDYLVYLAIRVLICIVQAMPIDTGRSVARWLAWLFCNVLRIRADVVDENLAHAFAELSSTERRRLTRRMWEHLFLLVLEVVHAPRKIHETNWRHYISLRDEDRLVRLLLSDRPTLIITAHFGNFEVAGFVLAILGFPTYTVARTLDNVCLDRFLNRFRGSTGQHMIPKKGGYDQIVDVLARGETMTFLADQSAGRKGCWVEFFGRPASAHKAIALLALDNEAPMAVCGARRVGPPLHIELATPATIDPLDAGDPHESGSPIESIHSLTQWYTARLEEIIRNEPGQYWWLHRRWKDNRKARRKKRAA